MRDKPIVGDKAGRRFVPADEDDDTQALPPARPEPAAPPSNERRHVVIGPEHVGRQPGPSNPAPRPSSAPTPPPTARRSTPGGPPGVPPTRPRRSPPPPKPPRPTRSLARRLTRIALAIVVVLSVLVAGLFFFGWRQFSRIDRVNVGSALSAGGGQGTNYLIVG